MPTLIALLRGVNVGGHGKVPMPRLRELLTEDGYDDVQTYVQSGNIVLSTRKSPASLSKALRGLIADEFGVDNPVIVRTRDEIAAVVDKNPLADVADQPKLYQVTFYDDPPSAELVAKFEKLVGDNERMVVDGRELYCWHADGAARSKLWNGIAGAKLGTSRNWNTVTKLLAMADQGSG
jgi:uncharacterized protein (DUF1697 family)